MMRSARIKVDYLLRFSFSISNDFYLNSIILLILHENYSLRSPKPKSEKPKKRAWLKRLLVILGVLILVPLTLFTIGWFNRDRIIEALQDQYSESSTGTLSIGKVNASFITDFPNVGFTVKNITHTHHDTIADRNSNFHINEAKLVIGAGKLLRGDFSFKEIEINTATFFSEVISEKSVVYHEQLKYEQQETNTYGIQLPTWLAEAGAQVILKNVSYISRDSILKKYFDFTIHRFEIAYKKNGFTLNGDSWLEVTVNSLGFNTDKGTYFNGAKVSGRPKYRVDLQNNDIDIPKFPLRIDQQTFQLNANFDLSNTAAYIFQLENPSTDFKATKGLLTNSIAKKLQHYEIEIPFESAINIEGKFQYGNNPTISAEFSTQDNNLSIAERFHFKNSSFKGFLTNDIYAADSSAIGKKTPKDFKLYFDHITAKMEDTQVDIRDSYFQSTPTDLNFFDANVRFTGSNEALVAILQTDNFDFKDGTFYFGAHIYGDIPSPYEFLNKATGELKLNDTRVILKKNDLQLPVETLAVTLNNETSILEELFIKLPNDDDLLFHGQLKNISGLIAPHPTEPTISNISLTSGHLNINEVITMAKRFLPNTNSDVDEQKTLHETLDAIYNQFHPQFHLDLDTVKYKDVAIHDVTSKINFLDQETIFLEHFDFKYNEAQTSLKGKVKVYGPESQLNNSVYLNAEAHSKGPLSVFKELFNISLFNIESGDFEFSGRVNGNLKRFPELLNKVDGDLVLTDTHLYYTPTASNINVDSLSLKISDATIFLKHFQLQLDDLYPLHLSGTLKHFPNFLLDDNSTFGSVNLEVTAPFFDADSLISTLHTINEKNRPKSLKNKKDLHQVFKDINRFNPEIQLSLDSLKYKGLITERVDAKLYFENDSILKLEHLDVYYKETLAKVYGEINAHNQLKDMENRNPFDLDFYINVEGRSEDLNEYLKSTNFLFKSGHFKFIGNYKAQAKDLTLLNSEGYGDLKIGGTLVDYKSADVLIPVDSLHLEINNDIAALKTLDIQLPGKSKVYFSGTIDHFSDFIENPDSLARHSSKFSIYAPYLDIMNVQQFLFESNIGDNPTKEFDFEKWKTAMRNINASFYPKIEISIDTLKHDRIVITDFNSGFSFDNNTFFNIDSTTLTYYDGSIKLDVAAGIQAEKRTPIAIDMTIDNLDFPKLLAQMDYFDNDALKKADSIRGRLNYRLKATGVIDNDATLDINSLNGTLELNLKDLALYNYQPIMKNMPLLRSERFKNLRFRPITQRFEINDGELVIPQTELQSSAIQLFIEGRLKLKDHINIWLSVPWKNFKYNNGLSLPEKTTYNDAGSKFFLQFSQDANSKKSRKQKLKVKFRLSNRKLRKMRNNL